MKLPLWRRRQDRDLDEEIASHLQLAIAERVERGETLETHKNPCHALRLQKSNRTAVGQARP